jgi:hypothetical protein
MTTPTYERLKAGLYPRNANCSLAHVDWPSTMPTDGCTFWAGVLSQKPHVMPIHARSQPSWHMYRANAGGQMPQSKAVVGQSIASSFGWMRRVSIWPRRNHHDRSGYRELLRTWLQPIDDASLCAATSQILPLCRTAELVQARSGRRDYAAAALPR